MKRSHSAGFVPVSLILNIVLGVLFVAASGAAIWAYVNYQDQKNNVDAKISDAVKTAQTVQQKSDQSTFTEAEKLPTRTINGPAELGSLSLAYPKTWSVYLDQTGDQYEAYLYPLVVPALQSDTPYALRISILNSSYDTNVATYQSAVKSGALTATPATLSGVNGLRLDGKFSDNIVGSIVLVPIRDKTIRIGTQSTVFQSDFDKIVLPSVKFNK